MQALVSRRVDAMLPAGDNTFYQAFDAIRRFFAFPPDCGISRKSPWHMPHFDCDKLPH